MCGVGTIPRVINELGGNCIGCEIEEDRFKVASIVNKKGSILKGDFRAALSGVKVFNCIFTSMPFSWFQNFDSISQLDDSFIEFFRKILKPDGFILIDSIPEVKRNNQIWKVAENQANYFEKHAFELTRIIRFRNEVHVDSTELSTIMEFRIG